jgi:hypothetical protein
VVVTKKDPIASIVNRIQENVFVNQILLAIIVIIVQKDISIIHIVKNASAMLMDLKLILVMKEDNVNAIVMLLEQNVTIVAMNFTNFQNVMLVDVTNKALSIRNVTIMEFAIVMKAMLVANVMYVPKDTPDFLVV